MIHAPCGFVRLFPLAENSHLLVNELEFNQIGFCVVRYASPFTPSYFMFSNQVIACWEDPQALVAEF